MDNGFSKYFLSNMGVKQEHPLSPTLFGLCIDELEERKNKVVKKEGLGGPKLMHELIFILMYAEDVALFSYNLDDMQHLLDVLDTFCQISGLTINVDKNKNDGNKGNITKTLPHFYI